ncbi:MAG: glutathione synthase [Pseudomonadota bacterium]
MTIRLGVLMDPIDGIKVAKDTSLAMMLAAQKRGWRLSYFEREGLFTRDGRPAASMSDITVYDDEAHWFDRKPAADLPLSDLDCILMRLDPPFNMDYVFATYFLQRAADDGVLVLNNPAALRDINEKMYTAWFPDCCPPTLITSRNELLRDFHAEHQDIIVKPLDGMGGSSIFRLQANDPNISVVLETMTDFGKTQIMAQRYIPEITDGDKRILVVDGEPVSHALARMPAAGETRGNLAAGGTGVAVPLSARDREIVAQIGPELKKRNVLFAGIDVIGDWVTEINVTSPTCARELDAQCGLDIGGQFMDAIAKQLEERL